MTWTRWLPPLVAFVLGTAGLAGYLWLTEARYGGKFLLRAVYSLLARWWEAPGFARLTLAAHLLAHAAPEASVLDLGCATGALEAALLAHPRFRGTVTGVDWSPAMLERARRRLTGHRQRVTWVAADFRRPLPLPAGYQVLVVLGILPGIRDWAAFFYRLLPLLTPAARILCDLPGRDAFPRLEAALAPAGFRPVLRRRAGDSMLVLFYRPAAPEPVLPKPPLRPSPAGASSSTVR
ncbi:MAG: class I SAM-dependent methyltransferase [Firmicutes bacterium]|nr:class I SAM-dependent methyltransferase [Bacillota bacterium]